jgi:RimJ/RimL family protein N-acetyltransferase
MDGYGVPRATRDGERQELRTERLALRPVMESDLDALLALRNEPRVLAGTATGEELPAERMQGQLERWLALWRERGAGTWMIELEGAAIGFVALDPIGEGYEGVDPEALEIGVVVHPDLWGRSIAAEAGLAVAADSCARAGLPRLYATVDPGNAQSLAVIAKAAGARLVRANDGEELYELTADLS